MGETDRTEAKLDRTEMSWRGTKLFIRFPRLLAADRRLSPMAVRLALLLTNMDYHEKGIIFARRIWLANALGCSPGTISKYIKELEDQGYLIIDGKGKTGRINKYRMAFPRIESPLEMVQNYHVHGFGLRIEDLEMAHLNDEQTKDFSLFFEILKHVQNNARQLAYEGEKFIEFKEIEEVAVEEYLVRKQEGHSSQ
jgi:hypothetical protein